MSSWFGGGFSASKLKPNLKMSAQRIILVNNKKAVLVAKQKKEIAQLLAVGKEEKARIRVEHVIREDFKVEAYEILELLCELVCERLELIKSEKECPFDMREAISTLIYAANRTEIPELLKVRDQLTKKYGKEFAQKAMSNEGGCVNERVVHKLSIQPPNAFLVMNYLKEIAKAQNVDWQPEQEIVEGGGVAALTAPMPAPTGYSVQPSAAAGMGAAAGGVYGQVHAGSHAQDADKVECGRCHTVLTPPPGAPQFACPCGALLQSPHTSQGVMAAALPMAAAAAAPPPVGETTYNPMASIPVAPGQPGTALPPPAAAMPMAPAPMATLPPPAPTGGVAMPGALPGGGGAVAGVAPVVPPADRDDDNNNNQPPPAQPPAAGGGGDSFDALQARFAALQKQI